MQGCSVRLPFSSSELQLDAGSEDKRAFEDSSPNALWQYMVDYFIDRFSAEAKRILDTDVLDPQTQFSIRLYCHGAAGMTREWLLNDNLTPAEAIVRMMFASIPAPFNV